MRSRKPFLIFWPQYFEAKRSRSNGRRLPINLAIDKVELKEISDAAKKLGYSVEIEEISKYPKLWWSKSGRILVDTKGKKKSKVLLELSKEIRKARVK